MRFTLRRTQRSSGAVLLHLLLHLHLLLSSFTYTESFLQWHINGNSNSNSNSNSKYNNCNNNKYNACNTNKCNNINISTILNRNSNENQQLFRRMKTKRNLRNFDLPETLIFYGIDTILDIDIDIDTNMDIESSKNTKIDIESSKKAKIRPGVIRLMKESKDIGTPIIILSEHLKMEELSSILHASSNGNDNFFSSLYDEKVLHYRSSLEEYIMNYDELLKSSSDSNTDENEYEYEYEYEPTFQGKGIGYAPSPAALIDAVNTLLIEPRGFGGSSGFGVKHADAVRNPLPQHCVVFVSRESDDNPINCKSKNGGSESESESGSISRNRCIASRTAGMRVMYVEGDNLGSCTAEDVSDGIVETLGTEDDWEIVTMDDISTPGSFWLNMAVPKDENGDRVSAYDLIEYYDELRTIHESEVDADEDKMQNGEGNANNVPVPDEMDEDEIARILADMDSL